MVPGAGDGRCSIPKIVWWLAPLVPLDCCLPHDAAYELGRCEGGSEVDRVVADKLAAACVAAETENLPLTAAFEIGVRLGGWWSWHVMECVEED